jgi:hypothetical protein
MGAFVEGELHLVINAIVSKPIYFHFHFLSFSLLFSFYVARNSWGHCPGLVTRGDNVIHKHFMEMRRLARDETPFLLVMQLRATTLAW